MDIIQKKRFHFLIFVVGIIILSITAEKCRKLVGEEAASKSGQFTFLNCFDGGTGTLACIVKESVKLYTNNIRSVHVERARSLAIETALADVISQGLNAKDAAKQVKKEGDKAAKLATRKAKRVLGPIISSGWDFFEAMYFGGTITEGFLRGVGTLFGTYGVGFTGEQKFGRFGYLVGSQLGSWVGGRIGLMVYDVVNGVNYYLLSSSTETTESSKIIVSDPPSEDEEEAIVAPEDSSYFSSEPGTYENNNLETSSEDVDAFNTYSEASSEYQQEEL